jgi:hypothetical protein
MRRTRTALAFGVAGFGLAWFTRPYVEGTSSTLSAAQLYSQIFGPPEPALVGATQATLFYIGLYVVGCVMLGFVLAHLTE